MAERRENDPKRKGGPWPTPIGMGALAGYGDFEREAERKKHRKAEEDIIDTTPSIAEGNKKVKEYQQQHGY